MNAMNNINSININNKMLSPSCNDTTTDNSSDNTYNSDDNSDDSYNSNDSIDEKIRYYNKLI
jgi:hypothetical protein